jgi:trehalose 6-phosphate synthase
MRQCVTYLYTYTTAGMLSADLLGFQTYDYARHFLSTVESLLDADCSPQVSSYVDTVIHSALVVVIVVYTMHSIHLKQPQ